MIDLKQGDCLELMKSIDDKSIDLILTDPPYEINIHGGGKTNDFKNRKLVKDKHIEFIANGFSYDLVFNEFLRICKIPNILIFCSNKQISKIMSFFENKGLSTTLLVWNKTNPIPLCNGKHMSDIEFIVYVRGKGSFFDNSLSIDYKKKLFSSPIVSNKNRLHPTQKPIELLERYINLHCPENGIVLDPFMGSGSTGIACINTNRNFIGIELDPKYFEIAKKRMEK